MGLAAVLLPTLLSFTGVAVAQGQSRQTFELSYTTQRPAASTGFSEQIVYSNPDDPDAKPPAVAEIVLDLARGATIDTSVPQQCEAPDPVLIAEGVSACPDGSRVGGGAVTLDTGIPGPGRFVRTGVDLLNNEDELIFLFEEEDSGARAVSRSEARARRFVTEAPPIPGGPPDGFTAVKRVRLNVQPVSSGEGRRQEGYVTTPGACSPRGRWINTATFTYRDGGRQTVKSSTPCRERHQTPRTCRRKDATLEGTRRDETVRGTPRRDVIVVRGGDDVVRGRGGNDLICAGRGDDDVRGRRGRDRIYGGGRSDDLRGGRGRDKVFGVRGPDDLHGNRGRDRLAGGKGLDDLGGGRGFDHCSGGRGNDRERSCERPRL